MKLTKEQSKKFYSKLEYNFRKSNSTLVEKLNSDNDVELTKEEMSILMKKLEYRFRKSEDLDLVNMKKALD
jgi:transposase